MGKKQGKNVTLLDVAKHAGVSRATASLIVRNSPKVSEKTRKKVLQSMEELGYVYDRVAANMRSKQSTVVGTIITDVGNTFFSQLLLGAQQSFEKHDYTLILGTTFDSLKNQDKLISTMLEHRVGGFILCPVSASSTETVERISSLGIPVVLAVRELEGISCDFVGIDYTTGAKKAVHYLIHEKKHERIAFVGGIQESSTWKARLLGYRLAYEEAGLNVDPDLLVASSPTRSGGEEATYQVMELDNPPTAIFCFNDINAFGAMIALRKLGLVPGKDVDILGFDDIPEAVIAYPPLTTMSSFAQDIGMKAASLLHERMQDPNKVREKVLLEPILMKRESS